MIDYTYCESCIKGKPCVYWLESNICMLSNNPASCKAIDDARRLRMYERGEA